MSADPVATPARTAAWLLTPLAAAAFLSGGVFLIALGPALLLVGPLAVPPMVLLFVQVRYGLRVLRGRRDAVRPLLVTAVTSAVLLAAGAVIGLPGPTGDVAALRHIPGWVLAGVLAMLAGAVIEAAAAALLWSAR